MKVKLGDQFIEPLIEDSVLCALGKKIFERGSVAKITSTPEQVLGWVKVSNFYQEVQIEFNDHLGLEDCSCTCKEFQDQDMCKHITAVLFAIVFDIPDALYRKQAVKEYKKYVLPFDYMAKMEAEKEKKLEYAFSRFGKALQTSDILTQLNLEVLIKVEYDHLSSLKPIWEVNFRIGDNKLYSLKNLNEFFTAKKRKEPLMYGKGFRYEPTHHGFSPEHNELLDFVEGFMDMQETYIRSIYYYGYGVPKLVNG